MANKRLILLMVFVLLITPTSAIACGDPLAGASLGLRILITSSIFLYLLAPLLAAAYFFEIYYLYKKKVEAITCKDKERAKILTTVTLSAYLALLLFGVHWLFILLSVLISPVFYILSIYHLILIKLRASATA